MWRDGNADRDIVMTKLIAASRNFVNAPKRAQILLQNIGTRLNRVIIIACKYKTIKIDDYKIGAYVFV